MLGSRQGMCPCSVLVPAANMNIQHLLGSQIFDYWFDTSGFVVVCPPMAL